MFRHFDFDSGITQDVFHSCATHPSFWHRYFLDQLCRIVEHILNLRSFELMLKSIAEKVCTLSVSHRLGVEFIVSTDDFKAPYDSTDSCSCFSPPQLSLHILQLLLSSWHKGILFFFLEESLYIRSSPGIVIGETQYSPGRFNILHTEVDIICYTVCEAIEVLHVKTTHSPVLFSFSVKDNIQWFPLAF